jgi:hypothetical protein
MGVPKPTRDGAGGPRPPARRCLLTGCKYERPVSWRSAEQGRRPGPCPIGFSPSAARPSVPSMMKSSGSSTRSDPLRPSRQAIPCAAPPAVPASPRVSKAAAFLPLIAFGRSATSPELPDLQRLGRSRAAQPMNRALAVGAELARCDLPALVTLSVARLTGSSTAGDDDAEDR